MAWINEARREYKQERAAYKRSMKERTGKTHSASLISSASEDSDTDRPEASDVGCPTDLMSFFQSEISYNKQNDITENISEKDIGISSSTTTEDVSTGINSASG